MLWWQMCGIELEVEAAADISPILEAHRKRPLTVDREGFTKHSVIESRTLQH